MDILLLGNGFECIYNPNVRDFNKRFKKLIENEYETNQIIKEILQFCHCQNSLQLYNQILAELGDELYICENENDFVLEETLNKIGEKISKKSFEETKIFHLIKNFIGYVIYSWTKNKNEKLYEELDLLKVYRPDKIWTTNYTDSVQTLVNKINNEGFAVYSKVKLDYLHGKINIVENFFEKGINDYSFDSIEINLKGKNEDELKRKIENVRLATTQNDNLNFTIFGLSVKNDTVLFITLLKFLSEKKKNKLIFYYKTQQDKKDLQTFLTHLEPFDINNIKQVYNFSPTIIVQGDVWRLEGTGKFPVLIEIRQSNNFPMFKKMIDKQKKSENEKTSKEKNIWN